LMACFQVFLMTIIIFVKIIISLVIYNSTELLDCPIIYI
jgi:hypothetical protein